MTALRLASIVAVFFVSVLSPVSAHPLGNFTINRLVEVRPGQGALRVRVVLDTAEIPTFQLMQGARDEQARAKVERAAVAAGLKVLVDGSSAHLTLERDSNRLRPGAANLPTLYWTGDYRVELSPGPHAITVEEHIAASHLGWRDVTVGTQSEPTHELLTYPPVLLGSPRNVATASFTLDAAGAVRDVRVGGDAPIQSAQGASLVRGNPLSDMFARTERTPWFVFLTVLVAFGLGALHALEPGHGKALMAFTLVGSRASIKQAVLLATSLTVAHTAGVFLLGFALFFASGFAAETIYPWITLLSGIVIAVIGARTLGRFVSSRRPHAHGGVVHDHSAGHVHAHRSDHHHGDAHDHGGGHSHAIPGEEPMKFGAAVWAAMSGGIAPCPAAIVVMLAALRLHQLGYGMLLIVVFSLGLASVLTGIGVAVVHGAAFIARTGRFDRMVAYGPLASAVLISIVGAVMIGQGFAAQHISLPSWTVAALVIAAIAGYALTSNHTHAHAEAA